MKKLSWQYYLFITASIIMIASFLFLFKIIIFRKSLFLKRISRDVSCNTNAKNKEILFQENINKLIQKHYWNKEKEDSLLFSSRNYFSKNGILHDLLEEKTEIYPPVPNRWFMDNNLDYSNPNILNEDSDNDGFTNLEEWQGSDPYAHPGSQSSDPNNPNSRPLLWTKLRGYKNSLHKDNYYLDFMGVQNDCLEQSFKLQLKTPIPDKNSQGKNILSTKTRYLKLGEKIAELPLSLFYYQNKQTIYKETYYDVSELTIKNFITEEYWTLVKKSTLHPQSTLISIINGLSFDYILTSPPQKIYVSCGSLFELKVLPTVTEQENRRQEQSEIYQLIKLSNNEATLERNGHYYSIPLL